MSLSRILQLRFGAPFQKRQFDAAMDDEMRSQAEMRKPANIEAGRKRVSLPCANSRGPNRPIRIAASNVAFAGWIPETIPVEVRMSKGTLWLAAGPVTIKQTVR